VKSMVQTPPTLFIGSALLFCIRLWY